MDDLIDQFSKLSTTTNFKIVGHTSHVSNPPLPNLWNIEKHKQVVLHAMTSNMYTLQIEHVLTQKLRSTSSKESILQDLYHGDIPFHKVNKDSNYYRALNYIHARFSPPSKYRPVHILDVEHHYPHNNASNAEAPFSTDDFFRDQLRNPVYLERHNLPNDPKPSFGNMKDIIFYWCRQWFHEIKDSKASFHKYLYFIQLHTKTALINADDPNKLRSVWGFPRPANIAFIMFYWPLFAFYKRHPGYSPLLWGYETQLGGMLRLNYELTLNALRSSIITLDKSRFDKYYLFEIQDDIEQMIESWIDFDHGYMPTQEYHGTHETWNAHKADRLRRLFKWTNYAFKHAPIADPHGNLIERQFAGMPSGVYTTQFADTLHFGITNAATLFKLGFSESDILLYKGEGDDILLQLALIIPPSEHEMFLKLYASTDNNLFGSITRPEKCEIHNSPDGIEILGYRNSKGIPFRDDLDLIAQFYHTKQTEPTPSRTMAMAIGYAQASLGNSPMVYNVCKNVYEYLAAQGHSPSEESYRRTVWTGTPYDDTFTMPKSFPTRSQLASSVCNFTYTEPQTMKTFWPDWFTAQL